MSAAKSDPIRLGVIGLGRAFSLMLPTFTADSRVQLVAATDPRAKACDRFRTQFNAAVYESVEMLCVDPTVEAVYIASPHGLHAEHALIAARCGKAALIEKPMAVQLEDCTAMIDAARESKTIQIVGHSHSFNAPIVQTLRFIHSGRFGRVKMVHAMNYTDFLYRPRRPEELDTAQGGGVVFSQGAHQIDIVRLLCGGEVTRVRAHSAQWDTARPTECAYTALIHFASGAVANVTYSGFGHYDSDTMMDGIGELGNAKASGSYGAARKRLAENRVDEASLKAERNYGGSSVAEALPQAAHHQHFGPLIVSCEGADLRPTPAGVWVHAHDREWLEPLAPPTVPRVEVIDELWAALREGKAPLHDGPWARATLEVCHALLASDTTQFRYQVPTPMSP